MSTSLVLVPDCTSSTLQDSTWNMDTGVSSNLDLDLSDFYPDGTSKTTKRLNLHVYHIYAILKSPSLALSDPYWRDAMYDEYNTLIKNGTCVLVSRPPGANIVRYCVYALASRFCGSTRSSSCMSPLEVFIWVETSLWEFDMTDVGALDYLLGISITRDTTGMFLSQKKYAIELLERAHMLNCNPTQKSADIESKLGPEGAPISDTCKWPTISYLDSS
ncbi:ribonuclease H-like domain-containing protein [Tanacetum coccineum]